MSTSEHHCETVGCPQPRMVYAPWNRHQVEALNLYQSAGVMHPYTCSGLLSDTLGRPYDCGAILVAHRDGWRCPRGCKITEWWAHEFTADLETVRDMVINSVRMGSTKES